ncbi:MAG: hypothetical protein VW306_04180 [Gammaproteobacteria bacterium]
MSFNHDKAHTIIGLANLAQNRSIKKELEEQNRRAERVLEEQREERKLNDKRAKEKALSDKEHQKKLERIAEKKVEEEKKRTRLIEEENRRQYAKEKETKAKEIKFKENMDFVFQYNQYAKKLMNWKLHPIDKYIQLLSESVKFKNKGLSTTDFTERSDKAFFTETRDNYSKFLNQVRATFDNEQESDMQVLENILSKDEESEIRKLKTYEEEVYANFREQIDTLIKSINFLEKKIKQTYKDIDAQFDKEQKDLEIAHNKELKSVEDVFTENVVYKIFETLLRRQKSLSLFSTYRFDRNKCIEDLKQLATAHEDHPAFLEIGKHSDTFYEKFISIIKYNEIDTSKAMTTKLSANLKTTLNTIATDHKNKLEKEAEREMKNNSTETQVAKSKREFGEHEFKPKHFVEDIRTEWDIRTEMEFTPTNYRDMSEKDLEDLEKRVEYRKKRDEKREIILARRETERNKAYDSSLQNLHDAILRDDYEARNAALAQLNEEITAAEKEEKKGTENEEERSKEVALQDEQNSPLAKINEDIARIEIIYEFRNITTIKKLKASLEKAFNDQTESLKAKYNKALEWAKEYENSLTIKINKYQEEFLRIYDSNDEIKTNIRLKIKEVDELINYEKKVFEPIKTKYQDLAYLGNLFGNRF